MKKAKIIIFIIICLIFISFKFQAKASNFSRDKLNIDIIYGVYYPEKDQEFKELIEKIKDNHYYDTGRFKFERKLSNGNSDKLLVTTLYITNGIAYKYEASFDNYIFYSFELYENESKLLKNEEINFLTDYTWKYDGGYHTITSKANSIFGFMTTYSGSYFEDYVSNEICSSYDLESVLYYTYYEETRYIDLYVSDINDISLDFLFNNYEVYTDTNIKCNVKSFVTPITKANNGLYILELGAKRSFYYYATIFLIHIDNYKKYEDLDFNLSNISSYTIAYNEINNRFKNYEFIDYNDYLSNWNIEGEHYIYISYIENDKSYIERIKINVINDIEYDFSIKSKTIKTNLYSFITKDSIIKSISYSNDNIIDINIDFNNYINELGEYEIYINLINKANIVNQEKIYIDVEDFNNIIDIETSLYKLFDIKEYINNLGYEIIYLNNLEYKENWNKEGKYLINLMYYNEDYLYYEDFYINVINPELEEITFNLNPISISYKEYNYDIIKDNINKSNDTLININMNNFIENNIGEYDIIITVYNDYLSYDYHMYLNIYDDIKPIIIASNIITTVNNKLSVDDIKKYIYVEDEIDGEILDYELIDLDDYFNNYKKLGVYHFEISTCDKSNNMESKIINITVNKKEDLKIKEIILDSNNRFSKNDMINYLYKLNYINTLEVELYSSYFDDEILKDNYELTVVDKYDNLETFKLIINEVNENNIINTKNNNNNIIIIIVISGVLLSLITVFIIIFYKKKH